MSCLYILEINSLSVVSFAIIFSHSEGCHFTLLMVSFAVQKLLSLIRSHFYFCFYFHYSRRWVIEDLALCHWVFYVSLKDFSASSLTFRFLIHFEFIFVYSVGKCSNFILLHIAIQFSQDHLLKKLSLPLCIFLPPLSKISYPWVHGFISGLSILFHWSVFVPAPYCLDDCSFVV